MEVKKVRKKALVGIVGLLALAIVVSPMLVPSAAACEKYPAKVVLTGVSGFDTPKYTVKDGVMFLQYFKFWGTLNLYIDGSSAIPVNWVDVACGTYNIATNQGVYVFYEVWTLPGGGMVGFDNPHTVGDLLGIYAPTTHLEGHIIVAGNEGVWKGDILDVYTPDVEAGIPFTGFLLTP